MQVRCRCCHREELHGPEGITVVLAGGARRPPEPRLRAEFALLEALAADEVVVDACPACGMPRTTSQAGAPGSSWALPEVGLTFGPGGFARDGVAVPLEEVRRLVEARAPLPVQSRGASAVQGVMLAVMVGPLLLWVFLFLFWFNYVFNLGAASWAG
jgi:hypothetical protein